MEKSHLNPFTSCALPDQRSAESPIIPKFLVSRYSKFLVWTRFHLFQISRFWSLSHLDLRVCRCWHSDCNQKRHHLISTKIFSLFPLQCQWSNYQIRYRLDDSSFKAFVKKFIPTAEIFRSTTCLDGPISKANSSPRCLIPPFIQSIIWLHDSILLVDPISAFFRMRVSEEMRAPLSCIGIRISWVPLLFHEKSSAITPSNLMADPQLEHKNAPLGVGPCQFFISRFSWPHSHL